MPDDPRLSDEATGLPPLEEVEAQASLVVCSWASGSGVVANPGIGDPIPVRWLHLRGLVNNDDDDGVEWGQLHIAVPVEHAVDVAAALASGGMFDQADEPTVETDELFSFPTPTFPRGHAACRFRTIRLPDGRRLAVATEVPDNPGASVTNAAEALWGAVGAGQYDGLRPGLDAR